MHPIISIVGKSNSGKTTLIESLVVELKKRGYRVAVAKHATDFELDKAGKDSWRFSQAGGEVVAINSPSELAIIKKLDHDLTPQELSRLLAFDYDLLLAEGFKQTNTPKIEVHRKEQGKEVLSPPAQLLAVVTDESLEVDVPQFTKDNTKGLADVIDNWLREQESEDIELIINGNFIPMKEFVKNFVSRTMLAMVSELKGVEEIKSLRISYRRKA